MYLRGISAVGSAPHWQCGGQGFKSPMLHQKNRYQFLRCLFFYTIKRGLETNSDLTDAVTSNREKGPVDLLIVEKKVPYAPPKQKSVLAWGTDFCFLLFIFNDSISHYSFNRNGRKFSQKRLTQNIVRQYFKRVLI